MKGEVARKFMRAMQEEFLKGCWATDLDSGEKTPGKRWKT